MIDPDKVKGVYCSKQQMILYLNAVEEVKRLRERVAELESLMEYIAEDYEEKVIE